MSEKVEKVVEYPLTLVHEESGESVIVNNEVQHAAFDKVGFKEEKKKK